MARTLLQKRTWLALSGVLIAALLGETWLSNATQSDTAARQTTASLSGTTTQTGEPISSQVATTPPMPPDTAAVVMQRAAQTASPTQTSAPTEMSTLLFTIPGGEKGISVWSGTDGLYGIGVASDTTFWVGDYFKDGGPPDEDGGRLLHYSHDGILLGTLKPDLGVGGRLGFVHDVECWGSDIWAIIQGMVLRMTEDGRILAQYPDPGNFGPPGANTSALVLGASGEPLLSWDTSDTQVMQLADAAGNASTPRASASATPELATTISYPGRGFNYQARPAVSNVLYSHEGIMQAGSVPITLTMEHRLSGLHIFHVNRDDSFYALAEETLDNPVGVQETVLHYSLAGRLLEHARLPLRARYIDVIRRLAVGADGALYALVDAGRAGFEVRRVNFFPMSVPFPDPPSSVVAQATNVTGVSGSPVPSATLPPGEALYLCTIPYTAGLRYDEGPPPGDDNLRGFGETADGNFHIGGPNGLFDYTPAGVRLQEYGCCVPEDNGQWSHLYDMQVRGNDLWLLVGQAANAGVAHWATTDKNVNAAIKYPLPRLIDNMDVGEMLIKDELTLTIGPKGEALLSWDSPDTRVAVLADAAGKPVRFKIGPGAKTMLTSQPGYPSASRSVHYTAQPVDPGKSPVGYVMIGSKRITITMDSSLIQLHIFHVADDGSFYVLTVQQSSSSLVQFGTILHYAADGSLLGRARASGFGPYSVLIRRMAIGSDGELYYMISQPEGWDLKQPVFFGASIPLSTRATSTPTGTPTFGIYGPPATNTPTPASLSDLEAQSVAIVEADVAATNDRKRDFDGLFVRRWFKSEEPYSGYLNLWESPDVHDRVSIGGGRYLLFLRHKIENYWCQGTNDFYEVVGGTNGIFEISGHTIGWAGLPRYRSSTLERLINTLRPSVPVPTATSKPAAWPNNLARQINSADIIVEAEIVWSAAGGTQTVDYNFKVNKWLKKPGGSTRDEIDFAAHKCETGRMELALQGERVILFITEGIHDTSGWNGGNFLTGGPAGVYGIRDGVIFLGGYAGYQGASVDQFEALIRKTLAHPGPPDSSLTQRFDDPP